MKFDQETLVFTVLGGAIIYMFLTNLSGQHIDEEAEQQSVFSEMQLRAEQIKKDALDLHSKVGELDNVESQRRGIVERYLALERENENAARKYTGYSQFQKRSRELSAQIQDLVKKIVPQDLYHHDEEMLSPIPEGSQEGSSRGYSPTEGTFVTASRQAISDVTSLPVFTQNPLTAENLRVHNLERQFTLSRASEDLRSVSGARIVSPSPSRPRPALHHDIPAGLGENNRHNLSVGAKDGSRSRSAFVQLRSLHPSVKAADDRAHSRAGTNDATIALVNTESEVGLHNNETLPARPVAKVSDHVDQQNFANKDFGPQNPRHPVGEKVVRTFESDESKAAHEGNAIDNKQPASASSPFIQGEIPVADNRTESPPNDKRGADELESFEEGTKLLKIVQPDASLITAGGLELKIDAMFDEFVSQKRQGTVVDATKDEVKKTMQRIENIIDGRGKRTNQGAEFNAAIDYIFKLFPESEAAKAQIKAWKQQYKHTGFSQVVSHRRKESGSSSQRGTHARIEREEQGDDRRRRSEQSSSNLRSEARETAIQTNRMKRVVWDPSTVVVRKGKSFPIELEKLKTVNPAAYAIVHKAWKRVHNKFAGLWKGKQPAMRERKFYEACKRELSQSSDKLLVDAVKVARRQMLEAEAKAMGAKMNVQGVTDIYIEQGSDALVKSWNAFVDQDGTGKYQRVEQKGAKSGL